MALTHLYIARHGQAETAHPDAPFDDLARRLTDVGASEALAMFDALARLAPGIRSVWHSPAMRTEATAALAQRCLGDVPRHALDALAPDGSVSAALQDVLARADGDALVVGHMPHVADMVAALIAPSGARVPFEPAGVACVRIRTVTPRLSGELVWMLSPAALRAACPPSR